MKTIPNKYSHEPVMAGEVARYLITEKAGAYIDLTVGAGGHLNALAGKLDKKARLYGFDKDKSALELAEENLESVKQKVKLVNGSYGDIENIVEGLSDKSFDGALLDLGLSSMQLDNPQRGFAFAKEGPLDMRFDQSAQIPTAADLVNKLNEKGLVEIIRDYGEDRQARRIAAGIVRERQKGMILTSSQLADIVRSIVRPPHQNKSLARVFQAFRIAVNKELDTLKSALPKIIAVLKKEGRIAVITYHSLEDRIVKNGFRELAKSCICPPNLPQCVCNIEPLLKILTRRPVYASDDEIKQNTRARSAQLRAAEKIA